MFCIFIIRHIFANHRKDISYQLLDTSKRFQNNYTGQGLHKHLTGIPGKKDSKIELSVFSFLKIETANYIYMYVKTLTESVKGCRVLIV